MWNTINTEKDIENLMQLFGNFHDSCLKEIRYISGAFVKPNLAMKPTNSIRTVDIIFQRQYRNPTVIVMRFIGLTILHLAPYNDKYTCEICEARIFSKNGLVYWVDDASEIKDEMENYNGTWICANRIQWCVVDECIGDNIVFQGGFETE